MGYLLNLGLTEENINYLTGRLNKNVEESIEFFPQIVTKNYNELKSLGIKNHVDIFLNHTHMFLINPDKFKAMFAKYDTADLIRCLEKNGAVIEKL